MISQWSELKPKSILLRKNGKSIKYINKTLGIPMSTLSGWLKNVKLTKKQKQILERNWRLGLIKGRKKALLWHNGEKLKRIKLAESEALKTLSKINLNDKEIVELALAMLYMGEGFKKTPTTGIGNSDLLVLKFFLKIMLNLYNLDVNKIRFDLHLRADQNPSAIKKFWSNELNVPLNRFNQVSIDQRTKGRPTYNTYKGVCVINCGKVAIQRKLVYISKYYCQKIIDNLRG
jgi:hypothetical protein